MSDGPRTRTGVGVKQREFVRVCPQMAAGRKERDNNLQQGYSSNIVLLITTR